MKKVKSLRKVRICLTILVAAAVFLCFFLYYGFRENYTLHTTMIAHTANDACRELKKLSAQFGYDNALSELTEQNTVYMDGDSFYRLQQNYKGIPVYGRSIICVSDETGKVQAVSGNVVDITGITKPDVKATQKQIEEAISDYFSDILELECLW